MTYCVIELEQRSPEWHAFRKGKIGASQAAAILGVDPWKTKLQLWESIILDIPTPITSAMQRGIDLEDKALESFNKGSVFIPYSPIIIQSVEYPNLIASLDGMNPQGFHVEIKVPSDDRFRDYQERSDIPENYFAQVQHQLMISGKPHAYFFAFNGESSVTKTIYRDDKYIQNLLSQELSFLDSLRDFKPPEACDRDTVMIIDSELVSASQEYEKMKLEVEDLQLKMETLRKVMTGACHTSRHKIGNLNITKVIRPGMIDNKRIYEEFNVDTGKYRGNPIEAWRIT